MKYSVNNDIEGFRGNETSDGETWRNAGMLFIFTGVIVPALLAYGYLDLTDPRAGWHPLLAAMEVTAAALLTLNLLSYLIKRRRLDFVNQAVTVICTAIVWISLYAGSAYGTAIYWIFILPPAIFQLHSLKRGIIFNGIFFACGIIIMMLQRIGIVTPFYNNDQLMQAQIILLISLLLGYLAKAEQERAHLLLVTQRERLRVLLANLPVGIIMAVAPEGSLTAANAFVGRLVGRSIDPAVKAAEFAQVYHLTKEDGTTYPTEQMPLNAALDHGESVMRNDIFVAKPDGRKTVLRTSAAPVLDSSGRVVSAVAVYEDATKEHEIDRLKSEFVSFASHQLKTPLTGIKWSLESLLDGTDGRLAPQQSETLGDTLAAVERLTLLVADLLSVSRLESGAKYTLNAAPTDVAVLLRDLQRELAPLAEKRHVTLNSPTLPESVVLTVDEKKLREVFANLLSNAIKYARQEDGHVEIASRHEEGQTIFTISDDGIGIPAAQQPKVFERFFRAANVADHVEGTGLGLYIAKGIIEKHGGRLWFTSTEGQGSAFSVSLPDVAGV